MADEIVFPAINDDFDAYLKFIADLLSSNISKETIQKIYEKTRYLDGSDFKYIGDCLTNLNVSENHLNYLLENIPVYYGLYRVLVVKRGNLRYADKSEFVDKFKKCVADKTDVAKLLQSHKKDWMMNTPQDTADFLYYLRTAVNDYNADDKIDKIMLDLWNKNRTQEVNDFFKRSYYIKCGYVDFWAQLLVSDPSIESLLLFDKQCGRLELPFSRMVQYIAKQDYSPELIKNVKKYAKKRWFAFADMFLHEINNHELYLIRESLSDMHRNDYADVMEKNKKAFEGNIDAILYLRNNVSYNFKYNRLNVVDHYLILELEKKLTKEDIKKIMALENFSKSKLVAMLCICYPDFDFAKKCLGKLDNKEKVSPYLIEYLKKEDNEVACSRALEVYNMIFDKKEISSDDFNHRLFYKACMKHLPLEETVTLYPKIATELQVAYKGRLVSDKDFEYALDNLSIEDILKLENFPTKSYVTRQINRRKNEAIYIRTLLRENPPGNKIKAFIDLANEVVKTKDDKKINKFKQLLFAAGEDMVFEVDKKAMEWFVNNGRPEDLGALNNLRQLYGLKTELSEYWHIDPNVNDALRIRFDGSYSEIGAVSYNPETEDIEKNPHYYRKLSQEYQDFRPDYSRDFKPSEYNLHENEAFETLGKHGVKMPIKMLQQAFVELHMPPEIAQKLNATDLQHILVNYFFDKYNLKHSSQYDDKSSEDLAERIKEERRGDKISMKALSSKAYGSIREKKWKAFARNEQLVEFVSKDLQRYGIDYDTIDMFWKNARNYGMPVVYDYYGKPNIYGLRSSLHHAEPLRQGGTNEQSTIITLNIRQAGYVEKERYDYEYDDTYTRTYYNEGGNMEVHSHNPFHFFDNPCCYLYLKKDGHLTLKNREWKSMKRMMIITRPSVKLNEGEQVVYYGGPRECSCAIMDKDGNIRQASYDFWKDDKKSVFIEMYPKRQSRA